MKYFHLDGKLKDSEISYIGKSIEIKNGICKINCLENSDHMYDYYVNFIEILENPFRFIIDIELLDKCIQLKKCHINYIFQNLKCGKKTNDLYLKRTIENKHMIFSIKYNKFGIINYFVCKFFEVSVINNELNIYINGTLKTNCENTIFLKIINIDTYIKEKNFKDKIIRNVSEIVFNKILEHYDDEQKTLEFLFDFYTDESNFTYLKSSLLRMKYCI